ncbi:hypothetical protein [Pseudomonas sp. McL0111]|uniref:hypothetical protein n=1 Tax=Pseudomonas sp. McL0111 TaxID=3457357 RepID=UPI00403E70DD
MNSPVIHANDSLVLNGDFTQGTTSWTKGANPREVTVVSESYEGTPIKLLSAGNLGSIWQELTIPVGAGANARYEIECLYETRHTDPALLLITDAEGALLREIQLPPGSPRNLEEDKARIDSGQPLVFEPISYSAPFDLPLQRQDKIRVSVVAPYNADPSDYQLKVLITRIYLTLHLAPVALQTVKLDEELLSPGRTVHLCLGVDGGFQHRLEFVPEPDSPWIHTKAALTSDDNPQGAVISTPEWGVNQSLDLPWTLRCPMLGDQDPYLFKFNLVNQYTAEPYPMQVSLGHHRLVFRDVLEAAYYPVLALEQSVRLGVRVASWYTGQYLAGRTVTWTIEGQEILSTTPTDPEGWAYFDYLPASWGEFSIKASVASPYYAEGIATTTLNVSVLETDPWNELMAVVEGNALPWTQKTGYPNRGSTYSLMVRVPEVLRHTELAMRWQGDSADQLGVQVLPKLNQSVPVDGLDLPWQLICQDVLDGRFELQFVCSKLLLPSGKKPMSLARNVVRIGEVQEANKFPVVDERESVLLRVQVLHMVANGEGDPVNNAQVNWLTPEGEISTRSGVGGWASVLYQPVNSGDLVVTASVRAHPDAVTVERPFAVKALASSPWKNQVRILFDGVEVDLVELGLLCRRGTSHTLRIEPAAGSSLLNQLLTLQWREENPGIGLTVADIGVPQKLEAIGLEWAFTSQAASSISSLFSLTLSSPLLALPRELFGRLISAQLEDELTAMLDQVAGMQTSQTFFPCIGARHAWRYLPNALSPLVGLQANLMWLGTPPEDLGVGVEPPLDEAQTVSDGGVGWTLDFTSSKATGEFQMGLYLPALAISTSANPMRLGHNKLRIEDWRESATDAVIYKDEAWSWVRVVSAFTGQAASQITVQWKTAADSNSVATDDLGWSGFGLAPTTAGSHIVVANVVSPFDGYEEQHSLTVSALSRDPWETVRVRFDGHDEQPWGSRTYFPRRNGTHVLELLIEEGSPLLLQELTLGLTGTGPAELGLRFEPALGVPHRLNPLGFRYAVHCNNLKDGGFALRLGAERLARLSPANAMSLGVGEQVLKILAGSSFQQVLEWEQELVERVTVVSSTTGKGIEGVLVTWRNDDLGTVTSLTDFYGVATVRFKPHTPGAAVLLVSVGEVLYSESVALSFTLQKPRKIQALSSPKPNGHLGELVSAVVTVVSAITGEPLQEVEVVWDYPNVELLATSTDSEGNARVSFRLPGVSRGLLEAVVRGGYGGWDIRHLEFTLIPNDAGS